MDVNFFYSSSGFDPLTMNFFCVHPKHLSNEGSDNQAVIKIKITLFGHPSIYSHLLERSTPPT
jgi:hypothetical protein